MESSFVRLHPYLRAQLTADQVSHAYLFSGGEAEAQALAFAAALLCQKPEQDRQACGHCPVCCNLLAHTHPDCRFLTPKDGVHRVEQMRQLVAMAGLSPILGERKLFLLQDVDLITEDGANTLLKLLEEPTPDTVLILLSSNPEGLLPTVLSRCQLFFFGNGAPVEPELPEGMVGQAETLLQQMPVMPIYQVLQAARNFEKEREQQKLFFFALLKVVHQAAKSEKDLPMKGQALLRSANMLESALELISKSVNQKMLTDVVYLRLWQNSQL